MREQTREYMLVLKEYVKE